MVSQRVNLYYNVYFLDYYLYLNYKYVIFIINLYKMSLSYKRLSLNRLEVISGSIIFDIILKESSPSKPKEYFRTGDLKPSR